MILERVFLFEELVKIINDLFRMFLEARVQHDWPDELQAVRDWVRQGGESRSLLEAIGGEYYGL